MSLFFFTFHLLIMILLLPRLMFRISLIFPRYFCVKISYLYIHILNIYLIFFYVLLDHTKVVKAISLGLFLQINS